MYFGVRIIFLVQRFCTNFCPCRFALQETKTEACFTLIVRRAFLSWVREHRGRGADRRQFRTESHPT